MKRLHWLVVGMALAGLVVSGCGDDDGGTDSGPGVDGGDEDTGPGEDSGPGGMCDNTPAAMAADCPDGAGTVGACCARVSNESRSDAPEYRVSGLRILEPATLSAGLVRSALQDALDEERFNWLIRVTGAGADGDVSIETGFGTANGDDTYSFTSGAAPAPGDPNRWDPQTVMGTLSGEEIIAPALTSTFTVPILEDDGVAVVLELPLQAFELNCAAMTDSRTCIGQRNGTVYQTEHGSLQTYITVEDAMAGNVSIPPIDTSLCNFIAGMAAEAGPCTDVAQADWPTQPNAICSAGTCMDADDGACDPAADCNAWRVSGGFAAQGVEITD